METIKEEKKADLEQLLNSLIGKGWNVFGHKDRINAEKCNYIEGNYYNFDNHNISISLRELVSKESGLWQFVCENKLYSQRAYVWLTNVEPFNEEFGFNDYQFRLIESSLKDENELEDFLLQNIKIDVESK